MDVTIARWTQYMAAQDLTVRTIRERTEFILRVQRAVGDIATCTRGDLIAFLASGAWSNSTKQHYRSALHTFFTWMQDEAIRLDNPAARLPRVKPRKREPNPLTPEEIERVLHAGAYRRTRLMIALHYYLGLRVAEIARVHGRDDIDWVGRKLTTLGKGQKVRVLPIPAAMWAVMQDAPRDGYWFPNWKANRLFAAGEGHVLSNSVSTLLSQAIRRAGIRGHRPHDLRASTATEQSKAGVSPFIIQRSMRHESMATTTIYTGVSLEEIRAGLDSLPAVDMPQHSGRRRAA